MGCSLGHVFIAGMDRAQRLTFFNLSSQSNNISQSNRTINVDLSAEELDQRRVAMDNREDGGWKPVEERPRKVTASLKAFAKLATSADKGAVRDLSQLD